MVLPLHASDLHDAPKPWFSKRYLRFGFLALVLMVGLSVLQLLTARDAPVFDQKDQNGPIDAPGAGAAPPAVDSTKDRVDSLIQAHRLLVFSKTYCPYSKKAKAILNSYALVHPYEVVEVDLMDDAAEVKEALGQRTGRFTFPNVFLHGESIGGAAELEVMHAQGQLAAVLRQAKLLKDDEHGAAGGAVAAGNHAAAGR
ncbi:thioredoxin-like protein [Gongronella butleri]|nr:thioredoxin-like protein [Gongronella butleri]